MRIDPSEMSRSTAKFDNKLQQIIKVFMGEQQSKPKKQTQENSKQEIDLAARSSEQAEKIGNRVPNPLRMIEEHLIQANPQRLPRPKQPKKKEKDPNKKTVATDDQGKSEKHILDPEAAAFEKPQSKDASSSVKLEEVPRPSKQEETLKTSASKDESVLPSQFVSQIIDDDSVKIKPRDALPIAVGVQVRIKMSSCMYFKQGNSGVYSHDAFQLVAAGPGWSEWQSISDQSYIMKSKVDVLKTLKATPQHLLTLSELGTFVLAQTKWGYLIELEKLDCIYEGGLNSTLHRCIKIAFFKELLKRYAYYMLEDKEITLRDIRSTENDPRLTERQLMESEVLFAHQREEVGWMLNLERFPWMLLEVNSLIPLFDSGYYIDPLDKDAKLLRISDMNKQQLEKVPIHGAILASDIGSGKTASMLHLIHLSLCFDRAERPTLVVTPDSILFQWVDELKKFTPSLKYQILEKTRHIQQFKLDPTVNVLFASRSALFSVKNNPLQKIPFKRIVIDEVHEIVKVLQKSKPGPSTPQWFSDYKTDMIWGVTGTPHQVDYLSNLAVLGRLFRFPTAIYDELNIDVFRRCFLTHCIRKNANLKLLQPVIKEVVSSQMQAVDSVLYRAKAAFSVDEEEARKICFNILPYFELHQTKSTTEIGISIVKGRLKDEILVVENNLKRYREDEPGHKSMFDKLQRLTNENNFYNEVISILSQKQFECFICLQDRQIQALVLTECLHYCCSDCYDTFFKVSVVNQCPVCKTMLTKDKAVIHPNMKNGRNKIDRIMEALSQVKKDEKTIIFTQFHNLVQRIGQEFQKAGVVFMELRGEPSEINYRLKVFRNDPEMRVLLLSIEQAASGINLTEANHVFFAHPILGNDYETMIRTYQQCIGRAHRIGQTRQVFAKLFVGAGTIEASYHNYFLQGQKK